MIEKVNPMHPDKIADRIAGALVDMAYRKSSNPKIAVEVLIGHGKCHIIAETSEQLDIEEISAAVKRISGITDVDYSEVRQDVHLARNQEKEVRCGDNGIFKGMPLTDEQKKMSEVARKIYGSFPTDGKYILNKDRLIVCQSCCSWDDFTKVVDPADYSELVFNPLGYWSGGTDVDTGATNRKLGSDMADSVTGGGLHGKDLSKADVAVNIYAFLKAQKLNKPVELYCAIGDTEIDGHPYSEIVEAAREYIMTAGGFEKFAEWGLY